MREATAQSRPSGLRSRAEDNKPSLACHASASIIGCVHGASFACKPSLLIRSTSPHLRSPVRTGVKNPSDPRKCSRATPPLRATRVTQTLAPHSRPTSFCCSSVIMRLSVVPVAAGSFAPSPAAAEFVWWKVMLYFSLAFGGASFLNLSNSVGLEMPKRVKVLQGPRPDSVGVCCFRSCFEPLSGTLLPFPR